MYSFKKPDCYIDGTCNFVYVDKSKITRDGELETTTCQAPGDLITCGNSNIIINKNHPNASLPTNYQKVQSNAVLTPQHDPSYTKETFDILSTPCVPPPPSQFPYDGQHCAFNAGSRVLGDNQLMANTIPQGWPEYLDPVLKDGIENFDPKANNFSYPVEIEMEIDIRSSPLSSQFCLPPPATQKSYNDWHCATNYQGRILGDDMPVPTKNPSGWPEYLDPVLKGRMENFDPNICPSPGACVPPPATQKAYEDIHCPFNRGGRVLADNMPGSRKIPTGWPEYLDPVMKGTEYFNPNSDDENCVYIMTEPVMRRSHLLFVCLLVIIIVLLVWSIMKK